MLFFIKLCMGGVRCCPLMEMTFVKCIILESKSEMCNWSIEFLTTFMFSASFYFCIVLSSFRSIWRTTRFGNSCVCTYMGWRFR